MARARNIKPGFYKNEDLAECSVFARLLFPGLWMLADREGRLEDRPKRIKGEIFPYDSIDVSPLLDELSKWGFIDRYESDGKKIISICNFLEHQSPHGKEVDSEFPDKKGFYTVHERNKSNGCVTGKSCKHRNKQQYECTNNSSRTVSDSGEHGASTVPAHPSSLNPESGILNPEKEKPFVEDEGKKRPKNQVIEDVFEFWKTTLDHKKAILDDKRSKIISRHLSNGYTADDLKLAVLGCSKTPHNMGQNDRGEKYDSIDLIFRDADHIDRFIRNAGPQSHAAQNQNAAPTGYKVVGGRA